MPARRIVYVELAPAVGGSVISLYHLLKGLDRSRYEPCVILSNSNPYASRFGQLGVPVTTLDPGPEITPQKGMPRPQKPVWARLRQGSLAAAMRKSPLGQSLVHLAGFYGRTWPELRRVARALDEKMAFHQADLVHLNDVVCVSRAGIMAAKRLGIPAICHLRAMAWRTHYDRGLSKSLAGYICISQAVESYQRGLGGRTKPSWVVHNGVDLSEFDALPDRASLRSALKDLALGPDDQVIGSVGRLVEWKGHHILLQAVAQIAGRYPRLKVVVVGAPEENSVGYADRLRAMVDEWGLANRVIFVGYRHDIAQILGAIDIMVHAAIAPEPFGRVLIEAMAAGTTVIGSRAGAVPEIVDENVTGLLAAPGDVAATADAIAYALDHPDRRARWQDAAKARVAQQFSAEAYVKGVERVYEELLS